jgi:hypothetical protein
MDDDIATATADALLCQNGDYRSTFGDAIDVIQSPLFCLSSTCAFRQTEALSTKLTRTTKRNSIFPSSGGVVDGPTGRILSKRLAPHNGFPLPDKNRRFSDDNNGAVTPNETRNLKNLGQLALSGLMALAYMRYQQLVILGSITYFLIRRVGINGRKQCMKPVVGDTILVGGIFGAMQITQRLLGPARLVVELLVTAFFSYMFLLIASKKQTA